MTDNNQNKPVLGTACTESHAGNVILHLSDLHFLANPPADRINIENELLLTLEALPSEWKPNTICITGDISDKNNTAGYSKAESWIKLLLDKLNISPANLVICPGNHDTDSGKAKLLPCPNSPEEIEAELTFPIPEKYKEPFTLYTKLCDNLGLPPLDYNGDSSHLFGVKECYGLFFIVCNTCWFWDKEHNKWSVTDKCDFRNTPWPSIKNCANIAGQPLVLLAKSYLVVDKLST